MFCGSVEAGETGVGWEAENNESHKLEKFPRKQYFNLST